MLQEFVDQVENVARSVMEEMHTAIPGKIQSFNATKGLAVVQPYGMYTTGAGKKMSYPTITDVPVIIPQCATANIQIAFPIESGSDCLVIVAEQELDAWLGGGESENDMRFDLTSAIAIPGLYNTGTAVLKEACDDKSIILRNGSTKLKIKKSGVEVTGNLKVSGTITSS